MPKNVAVFADYEIIQCLLTTRTIGDAAKCVGCERRTIQRRMADPSFQNALQTAQSKLVATTTAELEKLAMASTAKLWAILEDDLAEDKTTLRAIGLILANAVKYKETSELIIKLEEVTRAIEALKQTG